jgi:hypothetical protein
MTDLRAAAQQALKSLIARGKRGDGAPETVAALRAALAQPEQEPVAWMVYTQDGKSVCVTDNPADFVASRSLPLYTHPPRREPLTVADLQQALVDADLVDHDAIDDPDGYDAGSTVARIDALHAWLKEKNHG